jgi:uncharacterized membrane protein YsdA (DUF1294 family)
MSDLERQPNRTPRRVREQRAYRLAVTGGTAGLVAVVGLVLTLVSEFSSAVWVIAAIVAAVCAVLFWRTVSKQ